MADSNLKKTNDALPETGYGLTTKGPNIKRLDVILEDMHSKLSEKWGVNTRQNPESLVNHLLTNIADAIAELWEFGEDVYYSQYPSSAEGLNLDNAAQFGGSTRETAVPSYYRILCTGLDGTVIPARTLISTNTNPATQLVLNAAGAISRSSFNTAAIKIASASLSGLFTVALDATPYNYTAEPEDTEIDILNGLADLIDDDAFEVEVDEGSLVLTVKAVEPTANHALILSENLTTSTVGTVITFATEENGDIFLPNGTVTNIVKAVTGLQSVENVGTYIAGRLDETDSEFRKSYADKIYSRSSRMLESIKSSILDNCQGVTSVAPYENDTNETDETGRPPHSIEIVVDGGDQTEIATQILNTKAGGISTYGSVEVELPGEYGENITVRFNRPTYLYIWFHVAITMSEKATLPPNYADTIKEIILKAMDGLGAGESVNPQLTITGDIYSSVPGIDYVDITMAVTTDEKKPSSYGKRNITVSERERAISGDEKIEVVISG